MFWLRFCALAVGGGALASCGPAASSGGFDSANPAAKMYAIENAARQGDRNAVRHIVEQLDSDDPGVRSLAIAALQRLTGETLGYHDYDDATARRAAIERWRKAIEANQVPISGSAVATTQHDGTSAVEDSGSASP